MKKVALLMSAMFLFGCGAGGGTTTGSTAGNTAGDTTGGNNTAGPVASFTISLVDGSALPVVGKSVALSADDGATNARVVVRQFKSVDHPTYTWSDYIENPDPEGSPLPAPGATQIITHHYTFDETYRKIYDPIIDTTNSTITFATPVSVNNTDLYTFDVLTYTKGTGINPKNTILKFGSKSGIQVGVTSLSGTNGIVINDICIDMAKALNASDKDGSIQVVQPTIVKALDPFFVYVNAKSPVNGVFEITATTNGNPVVSTVMQPSAYYSAILTVPSTTSGNSLTYNMKFFISSSMLNPGEAYTNWVRPYNTLTSSFAPLASFTM